MSATASMLSSVKVIQAAWQVIQTSLALTAYQYPATCTLTNGSTTDYLILGGGSAGSVLANRLSANSSNSVAMLESGGYAPMESDLPGIFTLIPNTGYDYSFLAENDKYSCQNTINQSVRLTQGKSLGGTSILAHMVWTQGDCNDYDEWAEITGDSSWNCANMRQYLRKIENLLDKSIMNSSSAKYHGGSGYLNITKEPNSASINYLNSFEELGLPIMSDISGPSSLGISEPLLNIYNGIRQNIALAYLEPIIERSNLCVSLNSTVKRIIISDGRAIGAEFVDSDGNTKVLYANKEVILSAGAINTPIILLESGIGPKSDLESLNMTAVADLPVGQNLQDHVCSLLTFQMDTDNSTTPASNPHKFPVPAQIGYGALNANQTYADYQVIGLVFPHDNAAQMQICSMIFKYSNEICDKFYAASAGRTTYVVVVQVSKPKSRGKIVLTNTNNTVEPKIYAGLLSNSSDLTVLANSLEYINGLVNTTYFRDVNATLVDVGLCSDSSNYWECYALAMSTSMNHFGGTSAMGSVLDSELRVKGINGLRVVDSSAVPTIPGNEILAAVLALAEKAADLILADA